MALADPGHGNGGSDGRPQDRKENDSIGQSIRERLGTGGGSEKNSSEARKHRPPRWGNGRPGDRDDKDDPPNGEETPPGKGDQNPKPPDRPGHEHPPGKDPCDGDDEEPPGETPPPPQSSGGGGSGGGAIEELPSYKPPTVPDMQLPDELQPAQPGAPAGPGVLDAGAGVVAAAPAGPPAPIAMPVIVAPPIGIGVGVGGAGSAGAGSGPPPAVPRAVTAEPPAGRIQPPANVGSNVAAPNASYRIGYTEYLRTAGLPQVAALAVPGLVGILVLTGAGGLVGYRQAKAGHAVRVGGSARFMR